MIIHQALHGYNQGHNRLASSYPLSAQDDDKMKMLSDWSEYSDNKDNSYITTYPLSDSKHYVVAKSWYADDMERPGCVWTHSLILDLTNLDEKFDFRLLTSLFKRPAKGNYTSYSEAINYTRDSHQNIDNIFQKEVLIWLYDNLVKQNMNTIMLYRVEQESAYYQNLILLLLQYLPLGFLKNIFMCSGSAYGRKYSNTTYNLQFATYGKTSLASVVKESAMVIDNVCDGIKSICKTMAQKDSDTSEVLRLFSQDIENSYSKLCVIGLLLKYLDDAIAQVGNTPSFSTILKLMVNTFPSTSEGENVKLTFCKKNISNLFSPESIVLKDLATIATDNFLNFENIDYNQRIISFKTNQGLDEYAKFLSSLLDADNINAVGEYIIKNSDTYLHPEDYNYLAFNYWAVFMSLVMANPNILQYSFWIDLPEEHFIVVYDVFRKHSFMNFDAWGRLFTIVLYRNHEIDKNLMNCFVSKVPNITFEVMEYLNHSVSYHLNPLIEQYCTEKASEVLIWLKNQETLTLPVAHFLVSYIIPTDRLVQNSGSYVWRTLYQCKQYETLSYFTFLFILGHNWADENGLQFIKRSFYPLHRALATDKFPSNLWDKIEPYTAKLRLFNEWDKCKKLRKGTVKYFKSSGYKKRILSDFTPEKELNDTLENIWQKV